MPKKTKKEKLIAQYRRKLQELEETPIQQTTSGAYVLPKEIPTQHMISTTLVLPENEFIEIKKDLVKTCIVVCIFLTVEFFLWKFLK